MTQRKPKGVSWESHVERQIREAQERGEFDNLPHQGQPLPGLDKPHDPLWWVRQLLERENLSVTPAVFELKKRIESEMSRIQGMGSESLVRKTLTELNDEIREFNRTQTAGPGSDLAPFDIEEVVTRWRDMRSS